MNRDYFQDALQTFNGGNWYGWKKVDSDGALIIKTKVKDERIFVGDVNLD